MTIVNKTVCDACGDSVTDGGWAEIIVELVPNVHGDQPVRRILAHVCAKCRCQASIPEDSARRLGNVILLNLVKRK